MAIAAAALFGAPASAQLLAANDTRSDVPTADAIAALRPGQYRWYDSGFERISARVDDRITATVSIPEQRIYVYRGGLLIGVSTVSTGMAGHETPTGEYPILQKAEFHRSNIYSNAPMPFMQRLTWDGIALHAGHNPGRPASHGCIRLPREFARKLFRLTERGTVVTVTDRTIVDPGGMWAPPITVDGHVGGEAFNVVVAENESWPAPAPMGGRWKPGGDTQSLRRDGREGMVPGK
ncbi:L,D-transpeptidase family protein [Sphingosinithalassobacter tenebrarum]|uniref:L,D-transpeptidase family protein n=2 Tax=Stakelama tenebrarum TaxID=2711215 RepID=A0A6G6YAC5_9SPHN|nr:L,D-transpeptidase family protein [Sphingosinithalassobacter tenebrarum]